MIVTGPNASGKTTMLKSTLLNIIFTQQCGFGFYSSCQICPYNYLHSYLNIPDTSGRDSLFQAEAKRCKEILNAVVMKGGTSRHFCIFDELFSGTNPEESVNAAQSFVSFVNKQKNVDFMLTTHFTKICKNIKREQKLQSGSNGQNGRKIQFKKMDVLVVDDKTNCKNQNMKYTYKMKQGISKVRGGAEKVLRDMNFPKEIVG